MKQKYLLRTLAAAVCLSGLFHGYALAGNAPTGDWVTGRINIKSDGGSSYCSMKNVYQNGQSLVFARDENGVNTVAVDFGDKLLEAGRQYQVVFSIPPLTRDMLAIAATTRVLVVNMKMDRAFYDTLASGSALQLRALDKSFDFDLSGTSRALQSLQDCVAGLSSDKSFGQVKTPAIAAGGHEAEGAQAPKKATSRKTAGKKADGAKTGGHEDGALRQEVARLRDLNRDLARANQAIENRLNALKNEKKDLQTEKEAQALASENRRLQEELAQLYDQMRRTEEKEMLQDKDATEQKKLQEALAETKGQEEEQRRLKDQLQALQDENRRLRQQAEALAQVRGQMRQLEEKVAQQDKVAAEQEKLQAELAAIKGQVEEQQKLKDQLLSLQDENLRLQQRADTLAQMHEQMRRLEEKVVQQDKDAAEQEKLQAELASIKGQVEEQLRLKDQLRVLQDENRRLQQEADALAQVRGQMRQLEEKVEQREKAIAMQEKEFPASGAVSESADEMPLPKVPALLAVAPTADGSMTGVSGRGLRNLLLDARIVGTGGLLENPNISSDQGRGYLWQSGNIYGSAQEMPVPAGKSMHDLVEDYITDASSKCSGDFARNLGDIQTFGATQVIEGEMACVVGDIEAAAALLFVSGQGVFLFITQEGAPEQMTAIFSNRDDLVQVLSKKAVN